MIYNSSSSLRAHRSSTSELSAIRILLPLFPNLYSAYKNHKLICPIYECKNKSWYYMQLSYIMCNWFLLWSAVGGIKMKSKKGMLAFFPSLFLFLDYILLFFQYYSTVKLLRIFWENSCILNLDSYTHTCYSEKIFDWIW